VSAIGSGRVDVGGVDVCRVERVERVVIITE